MTKKSFHRAVLGAIALVLILTGCSGPNGPRFQEQPIPGAKAVVYVYRPAAMGASLTEYKLWANGRHFATVGNGTFVRLHADPGPLVLRATAKANALNFGPMLLMMKTPEVDLVVEEGERYFLNLNVNGFPGPRLTIVDDHMGRAQIGGLSQSTRR